MKLSLIIPVYNRPDEVEELLESLTRQRERNFEVILVEDGSQTPCDAVAERFKDRLELSYYAIPNGGPGHARNYGAKQSKGDYLIVLDSDCISGCKPRIRGNKRRCIRWPGQGVGQLHRRAESHQLRDDLVLHNRRHQGREKENGQVLPAQLQHGHPADGVRIAQRLLRHAFRRRY